jgi:hypothetical protein
MLWVACADADAAADQASDRSLHFPATSVQRLKAA